MLIVTNRANHSKRAGNHQAGRRRRDGGMNVWNALAEWNPQLST